MFEIEERKRITNMTNSKLQMHNPSQSKLLKLMYISNSYSYN